MKQPPADRTDASKQAALDAYWSAQTPQQERAAVERMKQIGLWKGDAEITEIERLRGWLRYIEGNFRDGPECAAEALRGDPIPEGFEG